MTVQSKVRQIGGVTALALALQLGQPPQAHAALGGILTFTGNPWVGVPAIVIGGAISVGSGAFIYSACKNGPGIFGVGEIVCKIVAAVGTGGVLAGLLILDDQGAPTEYAALSPEQARFLGVSPAQAEAYNSELDEINAVRETIVDQLLHSPKRPDAAQAYALWQQYRPVISPDAYVVLERIALSVTARPPQH